MKDKKLSCADCVKVSCFNNENANEDFPEFCTSKHLDSKVKDEAMKEYEKENIKKLTIAAAEVESEFYKKYTRVQETIEFAKKIGAKKIGVASCVGLAREASTFAKLIKNNGFEVVGVACKMGLEPKTNVGIDESCTNVGINMCNPILQAKFLNAENTDLNVVIGLCVGHDSLFFKYSEAITTTLVVKDRITGHNPCAVLYQITPPSYYTHLLK